jgi:signal transduction histidine kinase
MSQDQIDKLERILLFRILLFTVAVTIGYLIMDAVFVYHPYSVESAALASLVFCALAYAVYKNFQFNLVKHFTMIIMVIGILGTFFTFDGLNGVFLLDFINLIFFGFIMFMGRSRMLYGLAIMLILLFAIFISSNHPESIRHIYEGEYEFAYLVYGIISRSVNSVFIALSVKAAYEIERKRVTVKNRELESRIQELNELYIRLESQAIEFQEQNEYINELNLKLEYRVNERTARIKEQNKKLIDFAYFNSHKVRGPLARILGIIELKKISTDSSCSTLNEYFDLVEKSANELDQVIKSINDLLESEAKEDLS